MKIVKRSIILVLMVIINVTYSMPVVGTGFRRTPKADDLGDHFGTEPVRNIYGPKHITVSTSLMREGVTGNTVILPINNFNREINPLDVVTGDLTNTAYDATAIIKPEMAIPKAHIKNTYVHDAVVSTPVHMGTQYEEKSERTLNRLTGEVSHKVIVQDKPIVGMLKSLQNVKTNRDVLVSIRTGQKLNLNKPTSYHGTD